MSFHLLVWRTSLIIIKPLIKHSISKKNGPKQCSTKYTVEWEVIKNYQYHLSPDEKKNIHRISIVVPPCDGEPPEGKVRGRYRGFSPSSNLSGCGAMAFLSARSLQRRYACDMPRWWFISKGKKCEFGKNMFSNSYFFGYCWKETTSIRRGKKCSQPAQTNPIVGLPFFTNSKA